MEPAQKNRLDIRLAGNSYDQLHCVPGARLRPSCRRHDRLLLNATDCPSDSPLEENILSPTCHLRDCILCKSSCVSLSHRRLKRLRERTRSTQEPAMNQGVSERGSNCHPGTLPSRRGPN